jgi:trafficking protein particle complex subunit 5
MGYKMGQKLLAITSHRLEMATNGKNPKREVRLLPVLLWVHTHLWKQAFGKAADSLERSTERADECR